MLQNLIAQSSQALPATCPGAAACRKLLLSMTGSTFLLHLMLHHLVAQPTAALPVTSPAAAVCSRLFCDVTDSPPASPVLHVVPAGTQMMPAACYSSQKPCLTRLALLYSCTKLGTICACACQGPTSMNLSS